MPTSAVKRELNRHYGCGTLIVLIIMLAAVGSCWNSLSGPAKVTEVKVRDAMLPRNDAVRAAAIAEFTSTPGIRHAEWLNGDLVLAVDRTGGSWQPVADSACAWVRKRGMYGVFGVFVVEASALRNKKWDQLARASCS